MFNLLRSIVKIPLAAFLIFVMWLIILGVLGLYDFAEATWDWDRITDPTYISTVATLFGFGILVFATRLIQSGNKIREKDVVTQTRIDEINNMATNFDTSDAPEFVDYENLGRRHDAYCEDKEHLRSRLLDHASSKDLDVYTSGSIQEKRKNRFCKKMALYDQQLDKDYLKKHERYLPTRFERLTLGFFFSGVQNKTRHNRAQENPSRPLAIAVHDNWLGFIIPTLWVSFLLIIGFEEKEVDKVAALLSIAWKVLSLIIQDISARFYAPKWNKATYIADTNLRRNLWFRYADWKLTRKSHLVKPEEAKSWQTNTASQPTITPS